MDLEQKEEHKQITIKDVVEEKICNENIDGDIHTWMNVVNVNVDLHIQRKNCCERQIQSERGYIVFKYRLQSSIILIVLILIKFCYQLI